VAESPDAIREAIDETRQELAETIEALGQKADVKGRVAGKVHETTEKAADQVRTTAQDVGERVDAMVPDAVRPVASAVAGQAQVASRTALDPENRSALVVIGAVVLALMVALPLWRSRRRRS
jgi:archaellum component FlaD/FlaE